MVPEHGARPGNQGPNRRAVALRYDPERDAAPVVVATGTGSVAERIIEAARAAGVPLHQDIQLVAALAQLDLGESIPSSLYPVIAELLVMIQRAGADTQEGGVR
ncbi:MAG: EscU/YscU/HrcU family type III secretion system export apparatus switch protein [Candidatus Sericytochromatia bacterium]|nr:EscU/YscU/HrcU family type III secretion system export apparatus switch protein [Candidatus Sericytochromatia bacterium]